MEEVYKSFPNVVSKCHPPVSNPLLGTKTPFRQDEAVAVCPTLGKPVQNVHAPEKT